MDESSNLQYHTAPSTGTKYATASCSSFSNPARDGSTTATTKIGVAEQIEHSKSCWSELAQSDCSMTADEEVEDNVQVFKALQAHPTWGGFFQTFGYDYGICDRAGELEAGEKFAEGGQAELFDVQVNWLDPELTELDFKDGREWVLKVFKKGTLLRHLQAQLPHGYLQFRAEQWENWNSPTPKAVISWSRWNRILEGTGNTASHQR